MEQEGRQDLTGVLRLVRDVQKFRQVDRERLNNPDPCTLDRSGRDRLGVRVVCFSTDQHELGESLPFPIGEQLVDRSMKRFATKPGGTGKPAAGGKVDPVVNGGGTQDLEFTRKVVGERFGKPGSGSDRQVRTVLIAGSRGEDQAAIATQVCRNSRPRHRVDCVRR